MPSLCYHCNMSFLLIFCLLWFCKISVKVKSDQDFEGSFTLIDVSQNNAEIAWHDVTTKEKSCDFTNLTSARIYRLEASGLEGCTLIIS